MEMSKFFIFQAVVLLMGNPAKFGHLFICAINLTVSKYQSFKPGLQYEQRLNRSNVTKKDSL